MNKGERFRELTADFAHPYREAVLRYVELFCDKDSGIVIAHPDYQERQRYCAMVAGIPLDKEAGQLILSMLDEAVVALMDLYLTTVQSCRQFNALISNEAFFDELLLQVRQPLTGSDEDKRLKALTLKATASREADEVMKRIEFYTRLVYGEHTEQIQESQQRITPEKMAKRGRG